MPVTAGQVIQADRGLVVAPAGCGKTELIVQCLGLHTGHPALVLTHTNAGLIALRERIARAEIPSNRYRLATIDGWAMRIAQTYPARADAPPEQTPEIDYAAFRSAAWRLVSSGAIDDVLPATYGRALVDEYQDCSLQQHELIVALAQRIPTCVFGDPLQAIFGFNGDPLASWESVERAYPLLGDLETPWRWRNASTDDLGRWLLDARHLLETAQAIDLTSCPGYVIWRRLSGNRNEDRTVTYQARNDVRRRANERLLIVGHSAIKAARHSFARMVAGVSVIEPVELEDMVATSRAMNDLRGEPLLDATISFAAEVMTGVNSSSLRSRVDVIRRGRSRSVTTTVEQAAVHLAAQGGANESASLLRRLYESPGTRLFRPRLFASLVEALEASNPSDISILSAAMLVREQRRHTGRRLPMQGIGSTLLLKGLEAEHVLILDADQMNFRNLYVALSRGSRTVTVLSRRPVINPAR